LTVKFLRPKHGNSRRRNSKTTHPTGGDCFQLGNPISYPMDFPKMYLLIVALFYFIMGFLFGMDFKAWLEDINERNKSDFLDDEK
jgi:hypothetical protein